MRAHFLIAIIALVVVATPSTGVINGFGVLASPLFSYLLFATATALLAWHYQLAAAAFSAGRSNYNIKRAASLYALARARAPISNRSVPIKCAASSNSYYLFASHRYSTKKAFLYFETMACTTMQCFAFQVAPSWATIST